MACSDALGLERDRKISRCIRFHSGDHRSRRNWRHDWGSGSSDWTATTRSPYFRSVCPGDLFSSVHPAGVCDLSRIPGVLLLTKKYV